MRLCPSRVCACWEPLAIRLTPTLPSGPLGKPLIGPRPLPLKAGTSWESGALTFFRAAPLGSTLLRARVDRVQGSAESSFILILRGLGRAVVSIVSLLVVYSSSSLGTPRPWCLARLPACLPRASLLLRSISWGFSFLILPRLPAPPCTRPASRPLLSADYNLALSTWDHADHRSA